MRRLAAKYLPREILERPKEGFIQPNHVWLRTEFDGLLDELLSAHQINKLGLFDPDIVQSMIAEHRAATHDHAFRIWTLVMFQMWHRTYIEEPVWPERFTA